MLRLSTGISYAREKCSCQWPRYPTQTAHFNRIFNYRPITPARPNELISQHPFVLKIWSVIFPHLLGDKVAAQRTPSNTPAKAGAARTTLNILFIALGIYVQGSLNGRVSRLPRPSPSPPVSFGAACLSGSEIRIFLWQLIINSSFQPYGVNSVRI